MADPVVAAPLISQLDPCELPDGGELDELVLSEALVERHGRDALTTRRIRVQESELRGLTLGEGAATEFLLGDARLLSCDLSNIRAGAARSGASSSPTRGSSASASARARSRTCVSPAAR